MEVQRRKHCVEEDSEEGLFKADAVSEEDPERDRKEEEEEEEVVVVVAEEEEEEEKEGLFKAIAVN